MSYASTMRFVASTSPSSESVGFWTTVACGPFRASLLQVGGIIVADGEETSAGVARVTEPHARAIQPSSRRAGGRDCHTWASLEQIDHGRQRGIGGREVHDLVAFNHTVTGPASASNVTSLIRHSGGRGLLRPPSLTGLTVPATLDVTALRELAVTVPPLCAPILTSRRPAHRCSRPSTASSRCDH
jgi:hypothetical protein